MTGERYLRGIIKCAVSLALLFTALAKSGLGWNGWAIVTIAAWSGMLWESAHHDLFGPPRNNPHTRGEG